MIVCPRLKHILSDILLDEDKDERGDVDFVSRSLEQSADLLSCKPIYDMPYSKEPYLVMKRGTVAVLMPS